MKIGKQNDQKLYYNTRITYTNEEEFYKAIKFYESKGFKQHFNLVYFLNNGYIIVEELNFQEKEEEKWIWYIYNSSKLSYVPRRKPMKDIVINFNKIKL